MVATEDWWEKNHAEDFYQFKLKPPPKDISDMWDDLYMDNVASGRYALAPSADLTLVPAIIETQAEESSGGNDSDMEGVMNCNLDDDADTLTPLGDPNESLPRHPVGSSNKAPKAYTPSFASSSKKKMRMTPGSKVFMDNCQMISHAIREIVSSLRVGAVLM